MKIKSQKDFFSGSMFTVVGVAFAWGATTYTVGTGAPHGSGLFPVDARHPDGPHRPRDHVQRAHR